MDADKAPVDRVPETGYTFTGKIHNDIYPAISAEKTPSLRQPGKVVLITGAGRGCGRAMALQYAQAGVACVILVSRTTTQLDDVETEIKKINDGVRVRKFSVDVSDEAAVGECAKVIKDQEGRLDVLVNNAGYLGPYVPIADSQPSEWWKTFEVNIRGPYLFLHAFLPLLVETASKKNGSASDEVIAHVVNVTSIGALLAVPTFSAYQMSKRALLQFTEFVNNEYGDKGVCAVGLHPGGVLTEMSDGVESLAPFMIDTPEMCGGFVVWLTQGRKKWLAGRYVAATWDVERLEEMRDEIVREDKLKMKLVV